jgi:GDP-4-dehydro-6-deoxy-D-mannose reductase
MPISRRTARRWRTRRRRADVRALVTGAGGFVGQWLCRALLREGWTVDGVSLEGEPGGGILAKSERAAVRWTAMDLSEESAGPTVELRPMDRPPETPAELSIARLFQPVPDAIFHLSGIAFQGDAANDQRRAMAVNVGGASILQRAVHRSVVQGLGDPLLLLVGSGEQYGPHDSNELPLSETATCSPVTDYALSKWMQEKSAMMGYAHEPPYRTRERIIATRSFNHSGPGQSPKFFLPGLCARVRAAGPNGIVPIGNTDVLRDFLHVEDVVSAYISLVARGTPGEVYNVCSGDGVRIGDLAAEVIALAGTRATLKVDPALQRPVDVPALVGSNAKLRAATGWAPKKSRSDIISDILASLDAAS